MEIYYSIDDQGDWYGLQLPGSHHEGLSSQTAVECAEDLYHNHDGWEYTWPLAIGMSTKEDGPPEVRFVVDMEPAPQFYAREIQDTPKT